ncbi:MAG: ACT domain-containing protein [Acetobacteraceae bacterium]|nr:ACT domain-containing protein [Acetobacteraceae bacterium]
MASLILTLVGPDRPGLVSALSDKVARFGGSWLESQMARLAGQFAGIVLIVVPDSKADAFATELQALESDDLHLTVQRTGADEAAWSGQALRLDLVGHDRPGIVRDITRVLAERKVNILELTTRVTSGSFSAEQMFHAAARLQLPDGLAADELKAVLEDLGNELMIDIAFGDRPATAA